MLTLDSPKAPSAIDEVLRPEQIRLLAEIGFVATGRNDRTHAEKIFQALLVLRPERDFPYLGLGITYLNAVRALDAILILERGRRMVPESVDIVVFLALACRAAKRNAEAEKLLKQLLAAHREDTPILRLAKQMQTS